MKPGEQLALARRWFVTLGAKVEDIPADEKAGRPWPSIGVDLGRVGLDAVEDPSATISLIMTIQLAPQVREAAKKLGSENQQKVFLVLRQGLMDNPRLAWSFAPQSSATLSDLDKIVFWERFRLSGDDAESFNRFLDALQELMTASTKIRVIFEATLGASPPPPPETASNKGDDASTAYR